MFVATMAFHARVSDPRVGGTYMTLLNTLCNFGGNWCQTVALWFLDGLTWKDCLSGGTRLGSCVSKAELQVCPLFKPELQYNLFQIVFVAYFKQMMHSRVGLHNLIFYSEYVFFT